MAAGPWARLLDCPIGSAGPLAPLHRRCPTCRLPDPALWHEGRVKPVLAFLLFMLPSCCPYQPFLHRCHPSPNPAPCLRAPRAQGRGEVR